MRTIVLIAALVLVALQSCIADPETETKELLVLHNEQRRAHMEKNVSLLVGESDTTVDFIEVNRGLIKKPTKEESIKRFQAYFDAVDFVKWDDVSPPVFSFSDDGSMATSIVDKIVITKNKLENNRLDTNYYAWLAVYKKVNGKWYMHRMGSTNR